MLRTMSLAALTASQQLEKDAINNLLCTKLQPLGGYVSHVSGNNCLKTLEPRNLGIHCKWNPPRFDGFITNKAVDEIKKLYHGNREGSITTCPSLSCKAFNITTDARRSAEWCFDVNSIMRVAK